MLEKKLGVILTQKKKTISVAESCSGGLLAHRLTNIPGSSQYFIGGVIVYANQAKHKLLGVPLALIKKYGAVSQPVAELMAKRIRKILNTDYGISITGFAGPSGANKEQPIGLTYIAIANKEKTLSQKFYFKGNRLTIKKLATQHALKILKANLK